MFGAQLPHGVQTLALDHCKQQDWWPVPYCLADSEELRRDALLAGAKDPYVQNALSSVTPLGSSRPKPPALLHHPGALDLVLKLSPLRMLCIAAKKQFMHPFEPPDKERYFPTRTSVHQRLAARDRKLKLKNRVFPYNQKNATEDKVILPKLDARAARQLKELESISETDFIALTGLPDGVDRANAWCLAPRADAFRDEIMLPLQPEGGVVGPWQPPTEDVSARARAAELLKCCSRHDAHVGRVETLAQLYHAFVALDKHVKAHKAGLSLSAKQKKQGCRLSITKRVTVDDLQLPVCHLEMNNDVLVAYQKLIVSVSTAAADGSQAATAEGGGEATAEAEAEAEAPDETATVHLAVLRVYKSGLTTVSADNSAGDLAQFLARLQDGDFETLQSKLQAVMGTCLYCSQALSRESSLRQGAGATCAKKYGAPLVDLLRGERAPSAAWLQELAVHGPVRTLFDVHKVQGPESLMDICRGLEDDPEHATGLVKAWLVQHGGVVDVNQACQDAAYIRESGARWRPPGDDRLLDALRVCEHTGGGVEIAPWLARELLRRAAVS